jgi:endonuclease YncB( thermonuclease family)
LVAPAARAAASDTLMFRIIVTALLLAALAWPAAANLSGHASVIDGDTLVVAGERVRLEGIDAPELHQTCTAYGQQWGCGRMSAEWLKEHLNGRQVECVGHARDRYQRLLAVCYVGSENLNEHMVREGWALDFRRYSTDYLQAEAAAKRAGAGIWRGQFEPPWEWRAKRR